MAIVDRKLIRCEETDPNRCQARGDGGEGQCVFLAVEGLKVCPKHGAGRQESIKERKAVHDYLLHKWQLRVDEFASSENVTSLRGEVGVLRLTLEQTLNMCHNDKDLLLYSHRIQDVVMKIDKVVNSVSKLEMKSGNLLDKSAALVLAGKIVDIISQHVEDEKAVDAISNDLIDLVAKLAGKDLDLELE